MLLRRWNTLACCFCGARIDKESAELTRLKLFPFPMDPGYVQFWSHRKCIDETMQPSFAADLDLYEAMQP